MGKKDKVADQRLAESEVATVAPIQENRKSAKLLIFCSWIKATNWVKQFHRNRWQQNDDGWWQFGLIILTPILVSFRGNVRVSFVSRAANVTNAPRPVFIPSLRAHLKRRREKEMSKHTWTKTNRCSDSTEKTREKTRPSPRPFFARWMGTLRQSYSSAIKYVSPLAFPSEVFYFPVT